MARIDQNSHQKLPGKYDQARETLIRFFSAFHRIIV